MKKIMYLLAGAGIGMCLLLCVISKTSAQSIVSGTVLSAEDGSPLPGATVRIAGGTLGTNTDDDGRFALSAPGSNVNLSVTSLGYLPLDTSLRLPLTAPLIISLRSNSSMLDETVVIGYGETSRRFNTGSVSKITAEEIEKQPVTNLLSALSGRMAGVSVTTTNGLPGGGVNIQIRGKGSILAGTEPLYVIDGVPFDPSLISSTQAIADGTINGAVSPFNSLNPNDIASISVLKDADATAIYGSRGANGVVLITTKKGETGKVEVDLTINQGMNQITNLPKMLSLQQYLQIRREAFANDGKVPSSDPGSPNYAPDLMVWDTTRSVDWADYLLGGTGKVTSIEADVSGGSKQTTFSIGGNYHAESTVLPGNNLYQRAGLRLSVQHTSSDNKFDISFSNLLNIGKNELVNPTNFISTAIVLPPHYPLFDASNNYNWYLSNPLAELRARSKINTDNILSAINLHYRLSPELNLKASAGYTKISIGQVQMFPAASLYPGTVNYSQYGNNSSRSFIFEPQINYSEHFPSSRLSVMVGGTYQSKVSEGQFVKASDFASEQLMENLSSAGNIDGASNSHLQYKYVSIFGRVTYAFKDKYIGNVSVRRDGSSRFGSGNRFGNFGAVGFAWIFSNEEWMDQMLPFISFGKVRASYGITGNDQITDYQYLSTYRNSPFVYEGISGLRPSRIANDDFKWENTRKLELAIELGLFKDRMFLTINRYVNKSSDQLVNYGIPEMTGFTGYQANLPAVVQNSGWEVELMTENIRNSDFAWSTTFNITVPRNELQSFQNFENSSYTRLLEIGYDISRLYGPRFLGVDPATGTANYEMKEGNVYNYFTIGKQTPDFYGGLGNIWKYRRWTADIFLQFSSQMSMGGISYSPGFRPLNSYISVWRRWRNPGDVTKVPAPSTSYDSRYRRSSANYFDASYLRLKNLSVAYTFPESLLNGSIDRFSIYARGQNLLTFWDRTSAILDPESGAMTSRSKNIPLMKSFLIGIQLSL